MKDKKLEPHKSDINRLKDLSEILTQYNLTAVEILEDEKKYRVEKVPAGKLDLVPEDKTPLHSENEKLDIIFSPMVGIFYDGLSADDGPLVKVGQMIKEGDVICVIEAMKTFTEIRADGSGIIKEICANNGDLIEYSQPLFKYVKQ